MVIIEFINMVFQEFVGKKGINCLELPIFYISGEDNVLSIFNTKLMDFDW